ncbi:MAG: precorrin-6Y C5,15-methyltransferase (decarboxylating) subunit CbiT [Clostridia bacterium]|nr:precorrin-6Y C5,15-methyltransferase (decarboxylating) subunit CbiT [Clostridia bacterium]
MKKMVWQHSTPGIPETLFERGSVPLTKTEVRVIALAKLKLNIDSTVLDIGCGTGSMTVEAGLRCPRGRITAIDRNAEAINLTKRNAKKFGLSNVDVICGTVPEDLPDSFFDRIFIGGGGSQAPELVSYAERHLNKNGILVADTILLDSGYKILTALEAHNFTDIECICLNISRGERLSGWMMKALNPIYIISGKKH